MASRWAVLVLRALSGGPHRYTELRTAVAGVSDKMLTATLQTIEGGGLVHRTYRQRAPA
jgi:DNA-binding HxlR family transcriptional regulator